jgi:hypothetical protein
LTILKNVGDGDEFEAGVAVNAEEGRIDGRTCEEGVSGIRKCPACEGEGGHKSAKMDEVISRDGYPVSLCEVVENGVDEAIMRHRIAEDAVIHPVVESLDHFRWGREIHVRNPEGLQLGSLVPFQGAGSAPAGRDIEDGHERER